MLKFPMPQQPIRSIVERALEKRGDISNFVAMPVLFEAKREESAFRGDHLRESSVESGSVAGEVAGIWHTPDSVEIVLNNGMRMSLETRPLTLAIKIRQNQSDDEQKPQLVTLIRDHAGPTPTVSAIEGKLRNLRQIYAIAVIVYGGADYELLLSKYLNEHNDLRGYEIDFEALLPEDEQLLLHSAGQGSFWALVAATAMKVVKKGPRSAFVLITTVLKGGQDRLVRYSDAVVKLKEFEVQKDRDDHLLSVAERIDKVTTPELKEKLLEGFNSNLKPLLSQTLPALPAPETPEK